MPAWWLLVAIHVATFVLRRLLTPKRERDDRAIEIPTVEEGAAIPIVVGTQEIAPLVTWYGSVARGTQDRPWYYANMHAVLCWGPIDAVLAVNFDKLPAPSDDLPVWRGNADDGDIALGIDVSGQEMFGGEEEEGGVWGRISMRYGKPGIDGPSDVLPHHLLVNLYDDDYIAPGDETPQDPVLYTPVYPGLCHCTFGTVSPEQAYLNNNTNFLFAWARNAPYAKPVTFLVARFPNPAELELSAATSDNWAADSDVNLHGDANPIAALYELLVDERFGVGVSMGRMDLDSWKAAALQMVAEEFGVSFTLSSPYSVAGAIEDVLTVIDGVIRENPRTGNIEIKLIRPDYELSEVRAINPQNATDMRVARSLWAETLNESRIRYQELINNSDRKGLNAGVVQAQNLANWTATGSVRSETLELRTISNAQVASVIAQRRLRATSVPLTKASWRMNREGFDLMRGDVVRLHWPSAGIEQVAMRIASIDYGSATDRWIQIDAVEDVFGADQAIYVTPPQTGWTTPEVAEENDSE